MPLHGLLSRFGYPSQSGTSVRQENFVELPSQIYEHWAELTGDPARLCTAPRNRRALPDALIARLLAARGFNQGFGTVEIHFPPR